MLLLSICLLFKVNKERVNSLFKPVQCTSSLTNGILLFYSEINCQKGDVTYLFKFYFSL